jgi:hypothetical protein
LGEWQSGDGREGARTEKWSFMRWCVSSRDTKACMAPADAMAASVRESMASDLMILRSCYSD